MIIRTIASCTTTCDVSAGARVKRVRGPGWTDVRNKWTYFQTLARRVVCSPRRRCRSSFLIVRNHLTGGRHRWPTRQVQRTPYIIYSIYILLYMCIYFYQLLLITHVYISIQSNFSSILATVLALFNMHVNFDFIPMFP